MEKTNTHRQLAWLFLAMVGVMLLSPDAAFAGSGSGGGGGVTGGNPLSQILCNVVLFVTGPVGSALATLAVIIIGVGALMGKVSWGMAIIVGLGVATVFGAPALVSSIAGSGGSGTVDCTAGDVSVP